MKIVVDEMPNEPCECKFATNGNFEPDCYAISDGYRNCMLDDDCECKLNRGGQCDKLITFQDLINK